MQYKLKITTYSPDIVWADVDENLFALTSAVKSDIPADTDILVLPELFATGFIKQKDILNRFSEASDGSKTLERVCALARERKMAICGTLAVRDNGGEIYNRAFFAEPSGEITFYDKRHLFSRSTESVNFSAGAALPPVVRYRGWNVAMAICYDLRFPAWLRNTDNRYDLMLIPANWPESRRYAWEHLLIARAIENQAYVVGCNRGGADDYGTYDDLTCVYDYMGKRINEQLSGKPYITVATLDKKEMYAFRKDFPVSADADKFNIL